MHDDLSIPDFLRIPQDVRRETWKGMKLTKPRAVQRRDWRRPKTWSAEAEAIERAIHKAEKEKQKARFTMLRARAKR